MPEIDPLISSYTHEHTRPRAGEALEKLKKIASLVKPIMRARSWRVGVLAEFYPQEQNLLGLNCNRGQKICLRLRYAGDATQFLPMEQVVDTMLHELSHNVHGPHDAKFHALWDQLREEYEGLLRKGYTGEGFLSEGKRLGGRSMPMDEARRIARSAAERRRTLTSGSGQKLGGARPQPGQDIRKVIVGAIERRNTVLRGCGAGKKNAEEIRDMADRATANGFETQADEDTANDQAIAQALWELVQEEERQKYGKDYIHPTAANPTGNGGGNPPPPEIPLATKPILSPPAKRPKTLDQADAHGNLGHPSSRSPQTRNESPSAIMSSSTASSSLPSGSKSPQFQRNPFYDLTQSSPTTHPSSAATSLIDSVPRASVPSPPSPAQPAANPFSAITRATVHPVMWKCPICTCHNPESFLTCDACASERPPEGFREYVYPLSNGDVTADKQDRARSRGKRTAAATAAAATARTVPSKREQEQTSKKMWTCVCGKRMEEKWWTCNVCGRLKEKS